MSEVRQDIDGASLTVDRIRFGPGALAIHGPNFALLLRGHDLTTLAALANAARENSDPLKITKADVDKLVAESDAQMLIGGGDEGPWYRIAQKLIVLLRYE